jgi:hypothetical protein
VTEYVAFATFVAAFIAAIFALLAFGFIRRVPKPLSRAEASELLRFEGDAIRTAAENNTRNLRQEIGQSLSQNQTVALDMILKLSEQLLKQVDAFGDRLEVSNKTTESRIGEIGAKLNSDIEQMGAVASANHLCRYPSCIPSQPSLYDYCATYW